MHSKEKIVFSSQKREDENATFISSDIAKTVADLKAKQGKDIWLYGGAGLIKTFVESNLVDVYRLSVHAVALGNGKPLFENLQQRLELELTDVNRFKSGVVQLIYRRKP